MDNIYSPLWDATLDTEARLDWLLEALSLDEKLQLLSTLCPDIPRLGIISTYLGGEAAHGVEAKHDRSVNWGAPRKTTTFPQPFGMSQTWDRELMQEIGAAVAAEARILYESEGRRGGLCRWAPLAEPVTDPRWGRTEECYGEDPMLAGTMSAAYIKGMRGCDEHYVMTAATVKYFYGGHTEQRPLDVSVSPRNQYEYFFEPYRRCVVDGGAEALMTANHSINGVPGLLNGELLSVVKDRWKKKIHIVGGENALEELCKRPDMEDSACVLARAIEAGVDCFADRPDFVASAARSAYERGLISMDQINTAIRNTFRTKIRLGMFNRDEDNGWCAVDKSLLAGEKHRQLALRAGREAIVLLKNEEEALPLYRDKARKIAVIGPLANEWFKDWNGGIPPSRVTPYEGIRDAFKDSQITYTDGRRRIKLKCDENRYVQVLADGSLTLSDSTNAEEFVVSDWDLGEVTFQSASKGTYLTVTDDLLVTASRSEAFGRNVRECFYILRELEGMYAINSWNGLPLCWGDDGRLRAGGSAEKRAVFEVETAWSGVARAQTLAQESECAIVVLGTNPMIGGKVGEDRSLYKLPRAQTALLQSIHKVNQNIILVIVSNYPHDLSNCIEYAKAVLFSPSGCQELGHAIADVISGACNPSGRLTMTWYRDVQQLWDRTSCDVITERMTYQYNDRREVAFPFGYGLSYTSFEYEIFAIEKSRENIKAAVCVKNTGSRDGAVTVMVYAAKEEPAVVSPLERLVGFERVFIKAGESREVSIDISQRELMIYDVITESMVLADGVYRFWLGHDAQTSVIDATGRETAASIYLQGDIRIRRDFAGITAAKLYDAAQNTRLSLKDGVSTVDVLDASQEAVIVYNMGDNTGILQYLHMNLWAEPSSVLTVTINDNDFAQYPIDTGGRLEEISISLSEEMTLWGYADDLISLKFTMRGRLGIAYFWFDNE